MSTEETLSHDERVFVHVDPHVTTLHPFTEAAAPDRG